MKKLNHEDALEVISACFDLLARREGEIRELYDRLQRYEPTPAEETRLLGGITPEFEETRRKSGGGWPEAIAICSTPLVGRSLMLLCPQMGLRIVDITDSGLDGLKATEKNKPDFAFVDLDVSDIDGLVLISRIREIMPDITIVALSGGTQENMLVSAIIAGADEVIGKPVQARRLMNAVDKLKRERTSRSGSDVKIPTTFDPLTSSEGRKHWSVI